MSDRIVDPRTLAGDLIASAGERKRTGRERRTEAGLVEAIREDERRLGRPITQGEREGFAKGFFGVEYVAEEVRLLAAQGLLDEEDGEGDQE